MVVISQKKMKKKRNLRLSCDCHRRIEIYDQSDILKMFTFQNEEYD